MIMRAALDAIPMSLKLLFEVNMKEYFDQNIAMIFWTTYLMLISGFIGWQFLL